MLIPVFKRLLSQRPNIAYKWLNQFKQGRKMSTHSELLTRPLSDFTVVKLSNKSMLHLSGKDVYPFLQGLITNDMRCLENDCTSLYSQLLNIKGRVLCDLFLYRDINNQEDVWVEVENTQTSLLVSTFKKYKIRKKVKIEDQTASMNSFAAFGCYQEKPASPDSSVVVHRDPRLRQLGWKIISPVTAKLDADIKEDLDLYKFHRYKLGVGEGTLEHVPEKALPLECNSALLNGVSFNKGCYIGQELTSRSHHTGVIRKRMMPIYFDAESTIETPADVRLSSKDKNVGVVRGAVNGRGIALLRIGEVLREDATFYTTDASGAKLDITTKKPGWWPEGIENV